MISRRAACHRGAGEMPADSPLFERKQRRGRQRAKSKEVRAGRVRGDNALPPCAAAQRMVRRVAAARHETSQLSYSKPNGTHGGVCSVYLRKNALRQNTRHTATPPPPLRTRHVHYKSGVGLVGSVGSGHGRLVVSGRTLLGTRPAHLKSCPTPPQQQQSSGAGGVGTPPLAAELWCWGGRDPPSSSRALVLGGAGKWQLCTALQTAGAIFFRRLAPPSRRQGAAYEMA